MNHAYRLVWNNHAQRYVPAPETARAQGKSTGGQAMPPCRSAFRPTSRSEDRPTWSPIALAIATLFAAPALYAAPAPDILPQGGQITAGQASIVQTGARMDINQTSQRAIIEWTGFDIGSQAQVNFNQPNAASVALNRVIAGEASQIHGQLTANGQVWLINPNGVLFGQGSRVDVGGLVASTLDTLDSDFLAGKAEFHRGDATGNVVNQGDSQGAVNAGNYVIAPSAAMTQQDFQNWHVTFADGTLTIDPAALTLLAVGADNKSKTYGNPDPALTWQLTSGALAQGDNFSGSLTRDAGENVGDYAIRQGTLTAGANYSIDFANGLLTINPAALTVTANAASKAYDGLAYSGGNGVSYSGFVNGETSTVLGGTLAYGGSSQAATQAGSYVIAPSGLTSGNYAIAFNDGTLTITPETETLNDRQPGSGDLLRIATSGMGGNDGNETPDDPGSGTLLDIGTQLGFVNGLLSFAPDFIPLPEE